MNKNDFFDIEDQIRNSVDNAFNYIDFKINNEAEGALNEVKKYLKKSSDFVERTINKVDTASEKVRENTNNKIKKDKAITSYVTKRPQGTVIGIVYSAIGFVGSGFWGISLVAGLIILPTSFVGVGSMISGISALFFIISIFLILKGINIRKRIKRFKKYVEIIKEKNYCKIESLASATGKSNKFIIKDLEKMISLDMFKEANMDNEKTYFMLGNEVYDAYLKSQESFNMRKAKEKEEVKETTKEEDSEVDSIIKIGKKYIEEIKSANESIKGEIVSEKLYKLEKIITSIFDNIERNHNKIPQVKKFINHYLPMTLKLVNTYKELDKQTIEGENIKKAKKEIEKSLDLINTAFEKMLDDLFEDVVLDVSTDISVLETLFTQEGLTKGDFKK